ncbi:HNH endonuclease signature motif containing protein [Nocardia sp. CDC160]|uniref:HNH endonuclease signature motif containing protein n=1 Tax=Nocardia sp. CDC160 TaxID=3112166 RepID=UPI002DBCE9B5|nr:HNH endonuclease signature motif containing protein [Nocardia sp. CDC160]MEC3916028.1 HNH endonuclease signature motif containing protein [Nocardia sp. CDC160]
MAPLKDLTRDAVLLTIDEFDRLGRESFLQKYGFKEAQGLFAVYQGKFYDSKALAGVAHGYLPGRRPLKSSEFSGGWGVHAAGVLKRLGFQVIDTRTETTVHDVIGAITGLRPAVVADGPMLKQAVVLLWAIGRARRGEARVLSWEHTHAELAPLLGRYRRNGERSDGRPDYPVAALYRAGLWTLDPDSDVPTAHGDTELRRWFDHNRPAGGLPEPYFELIRSSGLARVQVIDTIVGKFFDHYDAYDELATAVGLFDEHIADDEPTSIDNREGNARDLHDVYRDWVTAVENSEAQVRGSRRTGISRDPVRLAKARRAVLARSRGFCENPDCGNKAPDVTDRGEPVLEVDHVADIATGGRDHPVQMIALCPNCHAVKTRGRSRHELRERFLLAAQELHQVCMSTRSLDA